METAFTPYLVFIIIGITGYVSYNAFEKSELKWKYMFNAYQAKHRGEWYRLFSSGLIHADWMHLILNMYVLYMFGSKVEFFYKAEFGYTKGIVNFLLLYIGGIGASSLYSLMKHQNNHNYNALGASGAVSGVVFASIAFDPMAKMGLILIPIYIPGWIFGLLYLAYSQYAAKKANDNIGHDAHFWGAIWGFVITFVFSPSLFHHFLDQFTR